MVSRERKPRPETAFNQRFTRVSSNLAHQIHVMLTMSFIFTFGRQIAFTYLTIFLSESSQDGGLGFDPSFVGFMIMVGGLANTFALLVTGSLCDRFGRKRMMMASMIPLAVLTAAFSFIHTPVEFLLLYAATGVLLALNDPAYGAMIADIVPPERREEIYGLSYMISNLGAAIGPPVGGFLIGLNGYQPLFAYSACFVAASAIIVTLLIKESSQENADAISLSRLAEVFKDRIFILFCLMGAMTNVVYTQFYGLLSVYTTNLGFEPIVFGTLFSFNAVLVVALQIPIRKGTMRIGPTKGFIVAQLLYAVGFAYFMFAADFIQLALGVAVLTLGEIIFVPASSGFVANLAPADMRGRYMAMLGLFFGIGGSIGSQVAFSIYGMLADKQFVWGILGLIGFATLIGYGVLFKVAREERQRSK
jgi:MFS family permease